MPVTVVFFAKVGNCNKILCYNNLLVGHYSSHFTPNNSVMIIIYYICWVEIVIISSH